MPDIVAVVVTVVAELVVVLADETKPTVVVVVQGPEGMIIFPILFPTSSVKKTLNVPMWLIGNVAKPPPH